MQVYGEASTRQSGAGWIAPMREQMHRAAAAQPGLSRHSLLVGLLIDAGMLAQGMADQRFEAAGEDQPCEDDPAMALTVALARCCAQSWRSGFAVCAALPFEALARCEAAVSGAAPLRLKTPEGYAFYALYPELYAEAAWRCRTAAQRWQVIGLRSIGTSLAAMVAVALDAPTPRSLRPVGHPFDRKIVAAALQQVDRRTAFAIVDEGPGLSGSSMAAAGRWLQEAGVAVPQLHFFPSHPGMPGPEASPATRALWADVSRQQLGFDPGIAEAPRAEHRLRNWVEMLVGPLLAPLQNIGGGAWRSLQQRCGGEAPPPAHPWQERIKYLASSGEGMWLVKFAGLGRIGERALERSRALAAAGFTPAPAGLCHGFLVERWRADLRPVPEHLPAPQRAELLARIGDYLAFRARSFPADEDSGASLDCLLEMARCNAKEALGTQAEAWCRGLERASLRSAAGLSRVHTDNRMHRWEWLIGPSVLLKTDALDHASAHDLVGCQDIAWDVVGAEVEFGLTAAELRALVSRMAQQHARVDMALVCLLRPCYLAFQWAHFAMAASAAAEPAQAALALHRERYRSALPAALAAARG